MPLRYFFIVLTPLEHGICLRVLFTPVDCHPQPDQSLVRQRVDSESILSINIFLLYISDLDLLNLYALLKFLSSILKSV